MKNSPEDPGVPQNKADDPAEPWNLVADGYNAVILPMSEHFAREALNLAVLPPTPHIVDVATGPGALALMAAETGATVSALDFSPAMVANLQRRASELGVEIADLRVGDGQNLPYEDNSFDGAFSLLSLIFFPDRHAGFSEIYRVLKPDRRAVISSMASLSDPFTMAMKSLGAALPEISFDQKEPPLSESNELAKEMTAAGFKDVSVHPREYSETTRTVTDLWTKFQQGAAGVTLLRSKLGENRWNQVTEAVLDQLQEQFGDGPVDEIYTNHFGVGVK